MNYTVQYFIDKFEAIPEENFLVRDYGNSTKGCAMGLCADDFEAHNALYNMSNLFLRRVSCVCTVIIDVNNGDHPNYQQPTPKQRILAALYDIKKMQQPAYENISKSLAVLPVNETSDVINQPVTALTSTPIK